MVLEDMVEQRDSHIAFLQGLLGEERPWEALSPDGAAAHHLADGALPDPRTAAAGNARSVTCERAAVAEGGEDGRCTNQAGPSPRSTVS